MVVSSETCRTAASIFWISRTHPHYGNTWRGFSVWAREICQRLFHFAVTASEVCCLHTFMASRKDHVCSQDEILKSDCPYVLPLNASLESCLHYCRQTSKRKCTVPVYFSMRLCLKVWPVFIYSLSTSVIESGYSPISKTLEEFSEIGWVLSFNFNLSRVWKVNFLWYMYLKRERCASCIFVILSMLAASMENQLRVSCKTCRRHSSTSLDLSDVIVDRAMWSE